MKFEAMFQPIQIGPMTVANRFVMWAITSQTQTAP